MQLLSLDGLFVVLRVTNFYMFVVVDFLLRSCSALLLRCICLSQRNTLNMEALLFSGGRQLDDFSPQIGVLLVSLKFKIFVSQVLGWLRRAGKCSFMDFLFQNHPT